MVSEPLIYGRLFGKFMNCEVKFINSSLDSYSISDYEMDHHHTSVSSTP